VRRCRSESVPPDPNLAWQIDALLTTPFVSAQDPYQDRQALWAAQRFLDKRLGERPMRNGPDVAAAGRGEPPRDRARRRFERMAAFLKLAGDEKNAQRLAELRDIIFQASEIKQATGADLRYDMSNPARVWSSLATCAEIAYALFEQRLKP